MEGIFSPSLQHLQDESVLLHGGFLKFWYPFHTPSADHFLVGVYPWLLGKPTILGNTHIQRLNTKHQKDFVNHKVGPNNRLSMKLLMPLQMAENKWVTGVKKTLLIGVIIYNSICNWLGPTLHIVLCHLLSSSYLWPSFPSRWILKKGKLDPSQFLQGGSGTSYKFGL